MYICISSITSQDSKLHKFTTLCVRQCFLLLSLFFTDSLYNKTKPQNIIQADLPFRAECLGERLQETCMILQKKNLSPDCYCFCSISASQPEVIWKYVGFCGHLIGQRTGLAIVGRSQGCHMLCRVTLNPCSRGSQVPFVPEGYSKS